MTLVPCGRFSAYPERICWITRLRPLIDFSTLDDSSDGPGYSMDGDGVTADLFMWGLTQSIPTYPLLDVTGPWAQNQAVWDMFETLPGPTGWSPQFGGVGSLRVPKLYSNTGATRSVWLSIKFRY